MNEKPRQTLCDLLRSHGVSLSHDRARCSGLLRDHCGTFKAETTVLLAAMEEGVPASLTGQSGNFATEILIGHLVKKMQTDRHLTEEAARWAVESWALALGISFSPGLSSGSGTTDTNRSQNGGVTIFCPQCRAKNIPSAKFCVTCGSSILAVKQPEPLLQPTVGPKYAGFWLRVLAYVIDWILSMILFLVVAVLFGIIMALGGANADDIGKAISGFIGNVISLVIFWLWYTLGESSTWQATPGKKILRLKVTDEQGNRISFGRANKRYWSKILSTLIVFAGFVMVVFTEKKQGLHDKIAGTLVVKTV